MKELNRVTISGKLIVTTLHNKLRPKIRTPILPDSVEWPAMERIGRTLSDKTLLRVDKIQVSRGLINIQWTFHDCSISNSKN